MKSKHNSPSRLLRVSSLLLLTALPLTSCTRVPTGATGTTIIGSQSNEKISLKVKFALPDARPEYLARVKKIEIKLTSTSSNAPVNDSFDVSISESTKELERTLSNVPTGTVNAQVRLLDADGKDVLPALTSSFGLTKDSTDAMLVKLEASPSIQPPVAPASTLSSLRQQRRDLLLDLQGLSTKEADILRQVSGLRSSPTPEDQTLRQQLQAELQTIQGQRQIKESLLEQLNAQLTRFEAQSGGSATPELQDQIFQQRLASSQLTTSITTNLKQRSQLSLEIRGLVRGEDPGRLSQLQGELQTLDKQIDDQIRQLQLVNLQLQQYEAKLTSQSASLPDTQRKPQLEADLAVLKTQISTLETEIPPLRQRIEALVQATDLQSVQRRDKLEVELKAKEADLTRAKALQADLQKQLDGIK